MEKYYHITSYNNLESICMYGLVPQNGERCKSINDERCAVFLSKGMDKTIVMYASLYNYYYHNSGMIGLKKIDDYKKSIIRWEKSLDFGMSYNQTSDMINKYTKAIEEIKKMVTYKSFSDYLGGDGCILSISNMNNIISDYPEDSVCNNVIPPTNINVVVLRNKMTKEIIDSRDVVISYFMSKYDPRIVMKDIMDQDIKTNVGLYYQINTNYMIYNKENYEIDEIPIDFYNYFYGKAKALNK